MQWYEKWWKCTVFQKMKSYLLSITFRNMRRLVQWWIQNGVFSTEHQNSSRKIWDFMLDNGQKVQITHPDFWNLPLPWSAEIPSDNVWIQHLSSLELFGCTWTIFTTFSDIVTFHPNKNKSLRNFIIISSLKL